MRILYIDDSGKVHPNDPSKFAVFAGFSVDEGRWHTLVRQLNGAKSGYFPSRDKPYEWEVKGTDFLTANAWKRARRRGLAHEFLNILRRNGCAVYASSMEKAKAKDALDASKYVPLLFQRLVAKFNSEVMNAGTTGSIVCDWSTYQMDHHVSNCTTSMVVANSLDLLRGGVTYGSSSSLVPLQVADIIAGAIWRSLQGQSHLDQFADQCRQLRYLRPGELDFQGSPVDSIVHLF